MADFIDARSCIFVKDERGLFTDDHKKDPEAEFISEITVAMLIERKLDDLIIERPCLEILQNSQVLDRVQIINGLETGNLTKALAGEPVSARLPACERQRLGERLGTERTPVRGQDALDTRVQQSPPAHERGSRVPRHRRR